MWHCRYSDPKRLFQEKELDFQKAFDVTQVMEAAAKITADLQLSGGAMLAEW